DALTATFAREGKPWGIPVNALGPGVIVTQANLDSMHPTPEEVREQWVSQEQLIEAALFLVTPAGDGVNGVVLPVQGKESEEGHGALLRGLRTHPHGWPSTNG